ncbi:MAG: MBL fold metallo-hydrolase [Phycisphaerales bacterium]|nr:MBL fold metallo-hydrolase [Phycisphaerales bacterium]
MRNGILGLLVALILFASVSIGLSLKPGLGAELLIDFLIAASACLAVVVFACGTRGALVTAFFSLVFIGIAWGGHASTRESLENIRAKIGSNPALIQFKAELVEQFKQPEAPEEDVLDQFQNAVEPPRFRALAQMIHVSSKCDLVPCSGTVTLFIDGDGAEFSTGDVLEGVGWIRGVGIPHNPGEIDLRVRSFRNNNGGSISVAGNPKIVFKASNRNNFYVLCRERVCGWVDNNLLKTISFVAPPKIQALVVAMTTGRELVGYRGLRESFSASGLSHFLAISGFNLAVLFGAVWICMELFHLPWIIRGWFLVCTAIVFLFVVDVETSVLRAGIAGILVGVSVACDRGWKADGLLAVAAIFTIACDPWAAWNPGFQLSYGAVLALRYGSEPIGKFLALPWKIFPYLPKIIPSFIKPVSVAFSASIAAWLMSTPITESHFGSVSVWSAIASPVLAPLAAVITVLASLACLVGSIPGVSVVLGYPLTLFASIFLWLSDCVGQLPAANIRGGVVPWWWSVTELGALCACWLSNLVLIKRGAFFLFVFLLITALFFPLSIYAAPCLGWKLRMTSISVGDGSAHVVETQNSCVLFDAGTISRRAGGSKLIVPALKAIGCSRFNAVFISHPHLDHFSALPEIANAFEIDNVYATEAFINFRSSQYAPGVLIDYLQTRGLKITVLTAGEKIKFDGFVWTVLHPQIGYHSRIVNDGSLTFQIEPENPMRLESTTKITSQASWLTLCGDSQTEAIAHILASASFRPSLVMELPHHGAWSDGVQELVQKTNPNILIQSTGYQRFRFDKIGPVVQNIIRGVTCRDGALRVTWFEREFNNRITNQILLERWEGEGWIEVACHTNPK